MNIADYLLKNVVDEHPVIITGKKVYQYHDLRKACSVIINKLFDIGTQPGDRVGILGENSFFWVAAYLSILKLGAVAVPLPTISTPEELYRKRRFVDCKAVCLDRRSYRRFSSALDEDLQLVFDDVLSKHGNGKWESIQNSFDIDQDAALMLTSGTTALPRAVRITHHNIQANTDSIIQYLELNETERILVVLPFYYCFGTSLLHTHLRVGGALVLCNTFAYPETALDMIETFGATDFAGVPSTYQTLLRNTSFLRRKFKSLDKIQQAGGKLPKVFIKELTEALPDAQVYVMYGQTEATARLSYLPPDLLNTKLGSVGKGIPGVTLRVLNEQGEDVQPGETGEIYAWGDNISPGYFNDPASSSGKFVSGALRTGDLATVDEEGYIYIVDRKADFIKSFGHRVSSQEVEAYVLEITEVVAAAAIGEPDLVQGEAIKVFVVLRKGTLLSAEEILDHCRKRMARHMVPKEIVIIDSLPTNAHGKVVKAALRSESRVNGT